MAEKKKKIVFSTVAMIMIFVMAVVYSLYHVVSLFTATEIKTIVSNVTDQATAVNGRGYVFRDETVLKSKSYTGAVEYLVADGVKVSKGEELANIYPKQAGDKDNREMVIYLDRQISVIERSLENTTADGMDVLRKEANDLYYSLMRSVNSGQSGAISSEIAEIMVLLNKMKALESGDEFNIRRTLASLKSARNALLGDEEKAEYAVSQKSGYFYYNADGYEEEFTMSAAEKLTADSFEKLRQSLNSGEESVTAKTYGKMAYSSDWKLVLPIAKNDAQKLKENTSYEMTFTENGMTEISMTFEKKITAKGGKEELCIFSSNTLPANFSFTRSQDVELTLSKVSGIYIPRTALATNDGIRGVYVLQGNVAYFRCIEVVYSGQDYCIVKENSENQGKYYSLGNNEQVIENSKNVFHERVFG